MAYVEYNTCYPVDQKKVIKFKPRVEVFEFQIKLKSLEI